MSEQENQEQAPPPPEPEVIDPPESIENEPAEQEKITDSTTMMDPVLMEDLGHIVENDDYQGADHDDTTEWPVTRPVMRPPGLTPPAGTKPGAMPPWLQGHIDAMNNPTDPERAIFLVIGLMRSITEVTGQDQIAFEAVSHLREAVDRVMDLEHGRLDPELVRRTMQDFVDAAKPAATDMAEGGQE
jgi:hypothetical protein